MTYGKKRTKLPELGGGGRGKKNVRNSEYSGFRLFGRIEWVPPLYTKKLLMVMRRTGKQLWGIFY